MFVEEEIYQLFLKKMPISCVDIVVLDKEQNLLMLKRKNEPAKNEWWFPGGRVLFGERRVKAAERKLEEECNLHENTFKEIGTYDVILTLSNGSISHAISTVFLTKLKFSQNQVEVKLDSQSQSYAWKPIEEWLSIVEDDFLKNVLKCLKL